MSDLTRFALVFLGAGTGGVVRFAIDRALWPLTGMGFPFGTLLINLTGSLAVGLLAPLLGQLDPARAEPWRLLLGVGVLGGYTTFSAFSRETTELIDQDRRAVAALYVALTLLTALPATYLATRLARP